MKIAFPVGPDNGFGRIRDKPYFKKSEIYSHIYVSVSVGIFGWNLPRRVNQRQEDTPLLTTEFYLTSDI